MARPKFEVNEKVLQQITYFASCGMSDTAALGIDRKTLYRRKRDEKAIQDAMKNGRALGVVEQAKNMKGIASAGNYSAIKFLLERLAPKDYGPRKLEVEHSGAIETPTPVEITLTDSQLNIISANLEDEFGGGYQCPNCGSSDCDMSST